MKVKIDIKALKTEFEKEEQRIRQEVREILIGLGEDYIHQSRAEGNYQDLTGDLRSANGYILFENEQVLVSQTGKQETERGMEDNRQQVDMELVLGNGMPYASLVEAKGFEVASGTMLEIASKARKILQ